MRKKAASLPVASTGGKPGTSPVQNSGQQDRSLHRFTAEGNIPNNSHYTHHTEVFFKLILLAAHYHNQHNLLFYSLNKGWLLLKWSGQKT